MLKISYHLKDLYIYICVLYFAALSAMFDSQNQPAVDSYIPQRVLSSSASLRQRSERPPWCECCTT